MRQLQNVTITVALEAPWLVHGNDPGQYGLDAVALRDHLKRPVLPGTLVAGRIAAAWTELRDDFGAGNVLPDPGEWFGRSASDFLPNHARLLVDDLVCVTPEQPANERQPTLNRIKIDDDEGVVQPGMLMLGEQTHLPGAEVMFKGVWRVWLADDEAPALALALKAGLLWQTQLGSGASIGLGVLRSATVSLTPAVPATLSCGDETLRRKRLVLRFYTPLCVGLRGSGANIFESDDVIPGAAIKAAIASMWQQRSGASGPVSNGVTPLARAFDLMRFTHGFPASDPGRRPGRLPLSLVASSIAPHQILDFAAQAQPTLVDGAAPKFQLDWKSRDWANAGRRQGWGETKRYLRVRTRIDATTRTAFEGELFAYECRVPEGSTVWLADITLPDGCDATGLWRELTDLLKLGIGPIGKTAAWGSAELSDDPGEVWACDALATLPDQVVLQLQSPALLFASDQVANEAAVDLPSLYRNTFSELSGGALRLSHHFASQFLAGGEYLWRRYGCKANSQSGYLPYILTAPGSVFVLSAVPGHEAEAMSALKRWRQDGLGLTERSKGVHGRDWRLNPFCPENGYGEVTVNSQHGIGPAQDVTQEESV